MKKWVVIFSLLLTGLARAQADSSQWFRAFPITDYMVDLNDSVKLVQVELPEDLQFREKQLGLVRGVYQAGHGDTVMKGYGRCQLIKGNFYYFPIGHNQSGVPLRAGDLLYTLVDKPDIYPGQVPKLAAHFIRLQDVYENSFFDRYAVFRYWTAGDEQRVLDSMVADIRFTGSYFMENNPSMNEMISTGNFRGKRLLELMKECRTEWVCDFFEYILARPRLYAGRDWKLSEIFATWLTAGAPQVIKE